MTIRKRKPRQPKRPETRPSLAIVEVMQRFGTEDQCRDFLEDLRWPDGAFCPDCGCLDPYPLHNRSKYECRDCKHHFSVKSGTMLHDSHLPFTKWFVTVYMMCESRKAVSANQVKRMIGVSYKTAWYLCHRIREAMAKANDKAPQLDDTVEADETFVGGKTRGTGSGFTGNKAMVAIAAEREGGVRMQVISDRTRKTLHAFLDKHVADDADAIYTDDWAAYNGIATDTTKHETVNHSIEEWVRGEVHTNTAEGVWSLLKRSIMGAYHHISHKHLDAYLDELEWRFGNRHNKYLFRDTLLCLLEPGNMEYKDLIRN